MKSIIHSFLVGLLLLSTPFICHSQWETASGLDGGKINGIANIDSILFASTDDYGIYSNKTGSWELAHEDITFDEVVTAGNCVFTYGYPFYSGECLRSFDLGENWEAVPNLNTIYQIRNIDTVIFFSGHSFSDSLLMRSFDYGDTYDSVQTPVQGEIVQIYCDDSLLIIHPRNDETICKIYYSDDYGISWDSLSVEGLFSSPWDYAEKIRYLNGTFWAIKDIGIVPHPYQRVFVYKASTDKWIDVTGDVPNRQFYNDIIEYNNNILCSHDLFSVLKFVEEDSSWVEFANGSKNVNQFLLLNDKLYCASDQGPYSLDTNGNWTAHTSGLNHRNVTSMDTYNGNIYLTANNELFYSTDGGNSFELIDESYGKQIITTDSVFYLISTNKFWMSWDEGDSWQSFTEGIIDVENQRFSHISITPTYYFLGTWESMYRSPSDSIDWVFLDSWPFDNIAKVEAIGSSVFFGEAYPYGGALLFSDDYGNSSSAIGPYCQFNKIDQSYYLLRDSIFYSDDEGLSWNFIPYPNNPYDQSKDDMDRISDTVVVIGYEYGGDLTLQLSYNLGEQWTDITGNLQVIPGGTPHYCKFVKIHENRIFMSSDNGLWYRDDLIVSSPELSSPENVKISVNVYPVPAKDELNIDFSECKMEPVTLAIFNLHGTQVYYERIRETGDIKKLNISHLNTGVYFLRFSMNNQNIVKKIIKF